MLRFSFRLSFINVQGLVKSIGLSNFNSEQVQDVLDKGTIKPVTNQVENKMN